MAEPALPHKPNPMRGILMVATAMLMLPFIDVIAKYLGDYGMPLLIAVWGRLFFSTALLLPAMVLHHRRELLHPPMPWIQFSRGILIVAATGFFFWALRYLPIADTLAIFFVQPLIITVLSHFFLGERVGPHRWGAVCVGFIGILIIVRPGFQAFNPGTVLALAAGASFAVYMIITRKLSGKAHAIVTTFHTNTSGTILVTLALPLVWQMPDASQWFLLALLGAIATLGHYLIVRGYDYAEASLLAPFAYLEMVTATIAGWYFFGQFPDNWTLFGAAILLASALYITRREHLRARRARQAVKQP